MPSWSEFLDKYPRKGQRYGTVAKRLADMYPEECSVVVKWSDLEHYDEELSYNVESKPDANLEKAKEAILDKIKVVRTGDNGLDDWRVYLRFDECPKSMRVPIRDIRKRELGHLIVVEGIAKRVNEVRPRTLIAAFKCLRCGTVHHVVQTTDIQVQPIECSKDKGGCGRVAASTKFEFMEEFSTMIDSQKVEVQERPEGLRGGSQPQTIVSQIYEDLTGKISAGDKVIITGILRSTPKRRGATVLNIRDIFLEANNIELVDVETENIEISEEEWAEINALKENPDVQTLIIESIAPSIYGYDMIKKAMMLQMFSGVAKRQKDGTRLRGDIHMLLIGDPGTAKSQLLLRASRLMPRSIYASGKSASAAGLTACATHDEFGEGKWTLEAGALVLADGGMACIDELDKMSNQDRAAMHEAMAQQTVTIDKANIHATLQSRCSLLAAANPKLGRFSAFSEKEALAEQFDLPSSLISRFDLIFPISDKPKAGLDQRIARHILQSHLAGQVRKRKEHGLDVEMTESREEAVALVTPVLSDDILRKYVFEGRKLIPIMTDEAMMELENYYTKVRKLGEGDGPVPITARQLEGLIRLSEASAKSRMSEEVTIDDAKVATEITAEFLDRIIGSDTEGIDIDAYIGVPKSQADNIRILTKAAVELADEKNGSFSQKDFLDIAKDYQVEVGKATKVWDKFRRDGTIYEVAAVAGVQKFRVMTK